MNILVVGAGALGTMLSRRMSPIHEVTLAVRPGQAGAIGEKVFLSGDAGAEEGGKVRILESPPCGPFDAIFLAVKSYDAAEAMSQLARCTSGPVGLPQNGILHLDTADGILGARAVFLSVTYGASSPAPGRAVFGGEGEVGVAMLDGSAGPPVCAIEAALTTSGFRTRRTGDARLMVWRKAGINCSINPLTAILRCANGKLLESDDTLGLMRQASSECEAVASGEGLRMDGLFEAVCDVCRKTAANRSSMLQDVERGRRTEIDAINLAVASRGKALGIPTPVSAALGALVKGLEPRTESQGRPFSPNTLL